MDSAKNEIFIAVFLGILVGLIFVLTFYFVSKKTGFLRPQEEKISVAIKNQVKPKTSQKIEEQFDLSVDPPDSAIISQTKVYKLTGKSTTGAQVYLITDNKTEKVETQKDGTFEINVDLLSEVTQVVIAAVSQNQEKSVEKIIYYETK
jgi:hypothetical protein